MAEAGGDMAPVWVAVALRVANLRLSVLRLCHCLLCVLSCLDPNAEPACG